MQQNHVKLVKNLIGNSSPQLKSVNWVKKLVPIISYLDTYTHWALTLKQLEENLANYDIQKAGYCLPELRNESTSSFDVTAEKIRDLISTDGYGTLSGAPWAVRMALVTALTPFVSLGTNRNGTDGLPTVTFAQLNPVLEYFCGGPGCDTAPKCSSEGIRIEIAGNFVLASKLESYSDYMNAVCLSC